MALIEETLSAESTMDWWLHGGSNSDELTLLDEYDEEVNHDNQSGL